MKLLLFQYRPAIRLYKYAETLMKMGHDVTIANAGRTLGGLRFPIPIRHILKVDINSHDLFLSFNTTVMPFDVKIPVIQCVGDLKSYDRKIESEIRNLRQCRFAFFASHWQRRQAMLLVPEVQHKSAVIINGMVPSLLSAKLKPKLQSDKATAVWSGTLSSNKKDKRFLAPLFDQLAERFDLHIYPSYVQLDRSYYQGNYTLHQPVPAHELVSELSQYQIGLIIWKKITYELTCSLPNKFFEYQAAGLHILHNYDRAGEITRQAGVQHIDDFQAMPKDFVPQKPVFYAEQVDKIQMGLDIALEKEKNEKDQSILPDLRAKI